MCFYIGMQIVPSHTTHAWSGDLVLGRARCDDDDGVVRWAEVDEEKEEDEEVGLCLSNRRDGKLSDLRMCICTCK